MLYNIWTWLQKNLPWFFHETDNLATLIGYSIAGIAAYYTYQQWRQDQLDKRTSENWKRKEVALSRVIAFGDTPGAYNAIQMLHWSHCEVKLWDHSKPEECYDDVTRKEAACAMLPPNILPFVFKKRDKGDAIRNSFGDLLGRLTHIEAFLKDELLTKDDVLSVLDGFLYNLKSIINSTDPVDEQFIRNFKLHIEWRGLQVLVDFFNRFDIDIKKDLQIAETTAIAEVGSGVWVR